MEAMGHIQAQPLARRLTHPVHHTALDYWMQCRGSAGGIPGRQDIDPLDIPCLLPWVSLVDVHRRAGLLKFRQRLLGTAVVAMRGRDTTGLWFDEIYEPSKLAQLQSALSGVVQTARPDVIRDDLCDIGKPHRTIFSLILPLAADRHRVDMLMAVSHYT